MRRLQGDAELAVGAGYGSAQYCAVGPAYGYRRAGFGTAGQAQAIGRYQQVDGRGRWGGVRVGATPATATPAAGRRRRTAGTEQAEPGNRPGGHGAASGTQACNQLIQGVYVFEGEALECRSIVLGVPQGAVLANEDNVAADTGLVHCEEIADGDFFPGLQGEDQVLPALGDGGQLIGSHGHLHDAWPFEIDIAPGALSGDFSLLIGDDDVVHGCSLLVSGSPSPLSGYNRGNRTRAGVLRTASTRQPRVGWLGRYSSQAGSNQMAFWVNPFVDKPQRSPSRRANRLRLARSRPSSRAAAAQLS